MKVKPKIYVVAITVPGDVAGGEIRNYNIIRQLIRRIGADVSVFCIASKTDTPEAAKKIFESNIKAVCHVVPQRRRSAMNAIGAIILKRIPPYMDDFEASGIGKLFRKTCEESLPDVVHIECLQAYYCIRPHISWLKQRGVKIVLDCHNVESRLFQNMLGSFSPGKRSAGAFLAPRLKAMEIEAARQADMISTCSIADFVFFKSYNPKTCVIANGVDCGEFRPSGKDPGDAPTLIFIGGAGYPPNVDAMQFYLKSIHPKVKEKIPNVKLLIIGTDESWLRSAGIVDASVRALGFVEDVKPYLAQATIGICPLRYGAGTRLKILTYMASGLAVVSTHKGAEGVNYADGRDILLADTPEAFSEKIQKLLNDRKLCDAMARSGRNFVVENYDWNVIGKRLAQAYLADIFPERDAAIQD